MVSATYDPAGVNQQVVGTTATQTLTNKTLTSPVINTPTGIVKADVGLGNVDNTSDASKNSATATLTNKTITDSTNNVTANSLRSATTSVDVATATAPSNGQVLTATSGTAATWQTPSGGAPDATTTSKGLVQLSGDLSGTAASPQIAAGVIVDVDVNASAAIAQSKIANLTTDLAAKVPLSTIDAAGDLLVGTGDNTVGRLPMGSALQVLRVNTGATALEYAAASGSGTPEIEDWTDLGNLGATETITGSANIVRRRKGTLDQNCAITLTTSANQQIDLQLSQDGTGGRTVAFSGVNVWATQSGSAPGLASRTASAIDRFYFENVGGIVTGYWLTETIASTAASTSPLRPSGSIAETFSRIGAPFANQATLSSGRLQLVLIPLTAGQVISSITFVSSTTALASGTNQWFALFDAGRNQLAVTVDDGATAWASGSPKTLTITGGYTVPTTGAYYVGVVVVATTVPSLAGVAITTSAASVLAPVTCGSSNTGLTTPASCPATANAITIGGATIYAYVS